MSAEQPRSRPLPPPVRHAGRSPTATDPLLDDRPLADVDRPLGRLRHGAVDPRAATEAIPDFDRPPSGASSAPNLSKRIRRERRLERARRERRLMITSLVGAVLAIATLVVVLVLLDG